MILPYLIALGAGALTIGLLNRIPRSKTPGELEYGFTLDSFRSKPINMMGDNGEYLGIDKVSYLLYKKEALELIRELNSRPYIAFNAGANDDIIREIKKKIKLMEYFESKYSYKALNE